MKSNLGWYKKPENRDKVKQIIKALDELDNNRKFCFGALDYNGNYFVYDNEPYLSNAVDKYKEWKSDDGYYVEVTTLEGHYDDWKETLISLTELKEFVATPNCASSECTEETASDSPELSVHLKKKLVLEIKEFSDGQCKYLVKESFGIPEYATSGCPLGAGAVGYIWTASSKQDLIDDARKLFTEKRDTLKWGEECEVSEDKEMWTTRMLVGKHPIYEGYIVVHDLGLTDQPEHWRYARPTVKKVEPKIEGDIYAWEMGVGDE